MAVFDEATVGIRIAKCAIRKASSLRTFQRRTSLEYEKAARKAAKSLSSNEIVGGVDGLHIMAAQRRQCFFSRWRRQMLLRLLPLALYVGAS